MPDDDLAPALRSAIEDAGLSLRALRDALATSGHRVSTAALSSWQSGSRAPTSEASLAAVEALEVILGTEPGRLRDAVGPRRRGGRRPRYDDLGLHMPPTSAAAIALERLGFVTEEDTPHELVVVQTLGLDARSPWATLDFDILVRALRTGPVRLPSVHTFDHDEVAVPPQIIPLRGCRIGPELSMPEARTFGTALVLDDDSQAGDTRFCSYRVRWRADPRATRRVTYSVSRPVEEILVQADFAGGLSPVGTTRFVSFAEDGDERDRVPMNASHRVQTTAHGFGPGVIGLAWDWE